MDGHEPTWPARHGRTPPTSEIPPISLTRIGKRAAGRLAWSLWGLTLACTTGALLLILLGNWHVHVPSEDAAGTMFVLLVFLGFATVGALASARHPENASGWIFLAAGVMYSVVSVARVYAIDALFAAPDTLPGGDLSAWIAAWLTLPPVFLISTFMPLVFPTGHLPSARWRPFAWLAVGTMVALTLIIAFMPGRLPNPGFESVTNPFGLRGSPGTVLRHLNAGLVLVPLCALAASVSLLLRLRHARGEERQQLKWFVSAVALVAVCLGAALVLGLLGQSQTIALDATRLAFTGLPVAAGIAMLRYRLWDIDILINRALVYATLTAGIIGLYVVVVGGVGALLQARSSPVLSLAVTGLVAVLFQPARARLQRGVNRLLWGERDHPYEVVTQLGLALERVPAPESVLPVIVDNVARALKLPHAAIWLVDGETLYPAAVHGQLAWSGPVNDPAAIACLRVATDGLVAEVFDAHGRFRDALDRSGVTFALAMVHRGELVGAVCLAPRDPGERFSSADRRLLRDLASHSSAAAHAVQLTTALQSSLSQLRTSREHLIANQEEERRRIQRDLHDGLGPTLASMRLRLEACLSEVATSAPTLTAELERLDDLVGQATADIRRLVYDLRPPVLDQLGLLPALQQWVERFSRETGIAADLAVGAAVTMPAAAEVAIFRVAHEAMVNVQKHALASQVRISLSADEPTERGDWLRLVIRDNGTGFDSGGVGGTGLISMRERAEALGGTLQVLSRPASGTVLTMTIPMRGATHD